MYLPIHLHEHLLISPSNNLEIIASKKKSLAVAASRAGLTLSIAGSSGSMAMSNGESSVGLGRILEFDGLRGIGVICIFLVHAGVPYYTGGYIWVDMFFVLSSFLITALLIKEYDSSGEINLRHFFIKRALRIVPPLFIFLIAYGLFASLLLEPDSRSSALTDGMYALSNISNWIRALGVKEMYYLGHTWSLSLEEQFYVIWPLLLIGLLGLTSSRRQLVFAVLLLALGGALYRAYWALDGLRVVHLYNALDMRVDELMLGAALGIAYASAETRGWINRVPRGALRIGAYMALALVIYIGFSKHWWHRENFIWLNTVAAVGFCVVFCDILVSRGGAFSKVLTQPFVLYSGKISYGLYLWHFPIFRAMQAKDLEWYIVLVVGTLLAYVAAAVSFALIEQPMMALKSALIQSDRGKSNQSGVVMA